MTLRQLEFLKHLGVKQDKTSFVPLSYKRDRYLELMKRQILKRSGQKKGTNLPKLIINRVPNEIKRLINKVTGRKGLMTITDTSGAPLPVMKDAVKRALNITGRKGSRHRGRKGNSRFRGRKAGHVRKGLSSYSGRKGSVRRFRGRKK